MRWATNPVKGGSLWRTIAGWLCVFAGVLGIVLPVIPGIPLLVAGLIILSTRYRWASVCLKWLKRQMKKVPVQKLRRKEAASSLVTKG
jgi:uncharacterized membrane protein YbaN (DUF454 family)